MIINTTWNTILLGFCLFLDYYSVGVDDLVNKNSRFIFLEIASRLGTHY